jgi:hypothetical protein
VKDSGVESEAGLRRLGFLGAVVLPLTYLPVLYGVVGENSAWIVASLFVLNVCCLLLGQGYRP